MSLIAKPVSVSIPVSALQPIACHVIGFSQDLDGPMPKISQMRFKADITILPHERSKDTASVAFLIIGYQLIADGQMKEFFHISTTTEFMLLDLEAKQVSMPSFLDIEMEPFSTCVSLAIGLTRGHLLTRFQGSLWPAFILPAINPDALIAEVKRRDSPSEQPGKKARPSKRKPSGLADEVIKPTDDLT